MDGSGRPLTVRRLAGAIGAEIGGISLAPDLPDTHRATARHLAGAWRDLLPRPAAARPAGARPPSPAASGRWWNTPSSRACRGAGGHPGGEAGERDDEIRRPLAHRHRLSRPPADGDHADRARGAALWRRHAVRQPVRAYETLSEGMRRLLDALRAVNSSAKADVTKTREDRAEGQCPRRCRPVYEAEHPVVRTHPETGRRALYVNGGHTAALRRHDRGGERAAAGIPVRASGAAGIHLPLPLGAGLARASGTIAACSTTRSTTITATAG